MITPREIVDFIECPESSSRLADIALAVFRYQFENVPSYRAFCEMHGLAPHNVTSLDKIPYISTVAFKYAELVNPRESSRAGALHFSTSGTTEGPDRRGRHVVPYPEIYRASAIAHLSTMLFPDRRRLRLLARIDQALRQAQASAVCPSFLRRAFFLRSLFLRLNQGDVPNVRDRMQHHPAGRDFPRHRAHG